MKARVGLIAFALLAIYAGWVSYQFERASDRETKERAAAQAAEVEAKNWKRAAEASQRELAATVPALKEELAAAKAAKVPVLAANRTQTESARFDLPVGDSPPSPTAGAGETAAAASPQPPGSIPPVWVSADVQTAVAGLDDGTIEWTTRIFATVSMVAPKVPGECGKGEPCRTKELPIKTSKTGVDDELGKAWKAWKNPPPKVAVLPRGLKQWRAGWFVGPGLAVALDGKISAGVLVGWGVQF